MMYGGMFMFGFGLIAMLMVIGLPVALIVLLVWALTHAGNVSRPVPATGPAGPVALRTCVHCSTALQPDWTHCPQCGAPV